MDSLPSGNKPVKLIHIKTEKVEFIITGKYKTPPFSYDEEFLSNCATLHSIHGESEPLFKTYSSGVLFYEHENYNVLIKSLAEEQVISFYHDNISIREAVSYIDDTGMLLSGILNFKNEIGYSDLIIMLDGKEYIKLTIEIFPKKLDYKKDYLAIVKDVNDEVYNLAFEFLRRTYLGMKFNDKQGNSHVEFFSILLHIYNRLIQSINIIVRSPHHILQKNTEIVSANKVKKSNQDVIKWLNKHPQSFEIQGGKPMPTRILDSKKIVTFDTYENQFLKFMLGSIVSRLENFKQGYLKLYRQQDPVILQKTENMIKELKGVLNWNFLRDINEFTPRESFSLVLRMAPGYREVYKYYLLLKKGLSLQGDVFKLSLKDLAELYEYWCFIKINSLLRKKYKLIHNEAIKINMNGIFVMLKKGKASKVTYLNEKNNETFTLFYNSRTDSRTVNQKPDNIFSITKNGSNKVIYNYVFDAKYKIDYAEPNTEYGSRYLAPGPTEEDINTMHRYRDAIVHNNKEHVERQMFGAYILFPYHNEEEYRNHHFYKSMEDVNIGGIPFLPSATTLLEEFLDELIGESSFSSYERTLLQANNEAYLREEYFKDRSVLVGALSRKEQLGICLQNKFYHTPLRNINLSKHNVKMIAMAQSKKLFGDEAGIHYYGKIKSMEIVPRKEIREIPSSSEELYVRFEIEEWNALKYPIKVQGYQVRNLLYTTEYLLLNSSTVSELCIRSIEEFRLWMELKRIMEEVSVTVDGNEIVEGQTIRGFSTDGNDFYVSGNELKVVLKDGRRMSYPMKEFFRGTKRINEIIKFLEST